MRTVIQMCRFSVVALMALCWPLSAQRMPGIYRIVIEECTGSSQRFAQSGFKLAGRPALYTALHGVTGCRSIKAFGPEGAPAFGGQELKIAQADISHDVAELITAAGLPTEGGLRAATSRPNPFESLVVYGFPSGRVVSRGTKVSVANPPLINLNSWVLPMAIRTALSQRASPDPNLVEFVDIDGVLMPGHSGAPLMNQANELVAVADGGLEGGKDNRSWAIPWSLVQLHPFRDIDNPKLGRAPDVLFTYEVETDEVPAIALQAVAAGSEDTIKLGQSGYIPGLRGALNPILDNLHRTYLYARNVAIEGGKPQPVDFSLDQSLQVEDSDGNRFSISITAIDATGATVSYKKLPSDQTNYISQLPIQVTDDAGSPLAGATVEISFTDGTFKSAITDAQGRATLSHLKASSATIIVSHPSFVAASFDAHNLRLPLDVLLHRSPGGGSLTLDGNTGLIPGLDGRLNPIKDSSNRTYIYADNIAINGGQIQPVDFVMNTPFALEDSHGNRFSVSVMAIDSSSSTIEYVQLPSASSTAVGPLDVSVSDAQNAPIADVDVLLAFKDGTVLKATTNNQGLARFERPKQEVLDVYVGKPGYASLKLTDEVANQTLRLKLQSDGSTNSVLFFGRTGYIPGLQGRLDPVLGANDRHIYAEGIDINGGSRQPVHFAIGEALRLRDQTGATFEVKVIAMTGHASLLEYKRVTP